MTLFIGGIKSGKSKNAEMHILEKTQEKPIYLATNEFFDAEMHKRVEKHKEQRAEQFITREEPLELLTVIQESNKPVLVECVSMWINNMLYHKRSEEEIMHQLKQITELDKEVVFVINDVSCSLVAADKLSRTFVDINGRVAQYLAQECDAVYNTIAGISVQIK